MKRLGKIAVCLAGVLALNAGLHAAGRASAIHPASTNNPVSANNLPPDNPYAVVAVRNIFGLVPPVVAVVDTNALLEASLPKITPTGIMGIFGHWQVLFKVTPVATGKQAPAPKEDFYILSEGQRQDDVEVITIDEKKSLVTFDNHGFTQELPLANAPASGGTRAAPAPTGAGNPASFGSAPVSGGNNSAGGFTPFGAASGGNNGGLPNSNPGANGGNPNGATGGMDFSSSTQGRAYQPEASGMTAEQTAIWIEAQRAQLLTDPHPAYSPNILPPTPLTKFNMPDGNTEQ